jgi:hypothetical protein
MSSTPDNQFQNRPDFVAAHEFMSLKGAQREAAYRAVNPMMALPALIDGRLSHCATAGSEKQSRFFKVGHLRLAG